MAVVSDPGQFKTASGSAERRFATVNPATGEIVREYPFLPSDEVTAVVEKAHEAFLSWREWPVAERGRVVRRAGDLMAERADALAWLITLEMGKLTTEAHGEGPWVAGILRYFGENGPGFLEPERLPVEEGEAVIVSTPLGVLLGHRAVEFPAVSGGAFRRP